MDSLLNTDFIPNPCQARSSSGVGFVVAFLLGIARLTAQQPEPGSVLSFGWQTWDHGFPIFEARTPDAAKSGIVSIVAGGSGAAALKADGSLILWRSYFGDTVDTQTVTNLGTVTALAALRVSDGSYSEGFAALRSDGSVKQIDGVTSHPNSTNMNSGVTAIAYAGGWLLAAKQDGSILLDGEPNPHAPPIPGGAKALAATYDSDWGGAVALKPDGTVVAWSPRPDPSTAPPEVPEAARNNVVAIAAGQSHFLALKANGTVIAWADSGLEVASGVTNVPPAAQSGVVEIAAGSNYSMALKTNGTVVIWGKDSRDASVIDPGLGRAVAISGGNYQQLVLVAPQPPAILLQPTNQTVVIGHRAAVSVGVSGPNPSYQWLRNGSPIPGAKSAELGLQFALPGDYSVMVSNPYGVVTSSPPAIVTVVPPAPGTVLALGAGRTETSGEYEKGQSIVPTTAEGGVIATAGGALHSLALTSNGSIIAWGAPPYVPSPNPAPAGKQFQAVAAGRDHSVALGRDGTVVAWGGNEWGQCNVPAELKGRAIAIAAGSIHSLALTRDGAVTGWGDNSWAVLTIPASASDHVSAIAAGAFNSVALKEDGSVVVWGNNSFGQLEVPEEARQRIIAIAAGAGHVLALQESGRVVAWGNNTTVSPRDASVRTRTGQAVVPVPAQSGVVAIACGNNHSVALKADGTVVAWGDSSLGQADIPEVVQGNVTAISAGGWHTLLLFGTAALEAHAASNGLILTWPATLTGFHLQTTSDAATSVWRDAPEMPSRSGDRVSVVRPFGSNQEWYRLTR